VLEVHAKQLVQIKHVKQTKQLVRGNNEAK